MQYGVSYETIKNGNSTHYRGVVTKGTQRRATSTLRTEKKDALLDAQNVAIFLTSSTK